LDAVPVIGPLVGQLGFFDEELEVGVFLVGERRAEQRQQLLEFYTAEERLAGELGNCDSEKAIFIEI
jgi:hypothetical protein